MTGCQSWYQTPDGEVFLWPAATFDYWWKTRRIDLSDYSQILASARAVLDDDGHRRTERRRDAG
jgi:hypothetical protein